MLLRNMQLTGAKPSAAAVAMPQQHKAAFEEGVSLCFQRWTALQLGVLNEWGGAHSREKAQALMEDVINWFYTKKGERRPACIRACTGLGCPGRAGG